MKAKLLLLNSGPNDSSSKRFLKVTQESNKSLKNNLSSKGLPLFDSVNSNPLKSSIDNGGGTG